MAFSNNGEHLASLLQDKLTVWDYTTGQCLKTSRIDTDRSLILSMSYSRSGIVFVSKDLARSITIWDAATGLRLKKLDCECRMGVTSACFSKDGATLAASSHSKTIKLWDVATGDCKVTFTVRPMVYRLRFSESGSQLNTPFGIINLESLSTPGTRMSKPQRLETTRSNSQGLMLSEEIESAWIQKNSKSILWIPPEYRQGSSGKGRGWVFDVRGSAIALACPPSRVLVIEFSADLSVM